MTLSGAIAVVAGTAAFTALAGRAAGFLLIPGLLASLVSGRYAFTLGAAIGIGGVLAADRRTPALAAGLGALTALASPVAAVFTALAGVALGVSGVRRREGATLTAGAAIPAIVLAVAFPEEGTFPFVPSSFAPALGAALAVVVLARPEDRALRAGAALYALLCVAAFAVPTPAGGNVARLGILVTPPVAWLVLRGRRPLVLAALAAPLAYWVLQPAVRDVHAGASDPALSAAFHEPLVGFLSDRTPTRVEIPTTRNHGEALHVARFVSIARGWSRQLDRKRAALFYADGALSPERYARWLRANAVAYVALPLGVAFDESAGAEAALVRSRPTFLREIWRSEHWRVFAVRDPAPLAVGTAALDRLETDAFTLRAAGAGRTRVRVQWSPYWRIARGSGCVLRTRGGWTAVDATGPGTIRVQARFDARRILARAPACRSRRGR